MTSEFAPKVRRIDVFDDMIGGPADARERGGRYAEGRYGAAAGPEPGGTLESVLAALDRLREGFKDAVARLIGTSASRAIARLVRLLLGAGGDGCGRGGYGGACGRDGGQRDRWDGEADDEDGYAADSPVPDPAGRPTLLATMAAGLLALLTWLAPLASWAGTLIG